MDMTDKKKRRWWDIGITNLVVVQWIGWLLLWRVDAYVALLLSILVGGVVSAVLIIAWMAELLEASRVPRVYFTIMLTVAASAGLTAVLHCWLWGFPLGW
jgi:hypothetical protein